MIISNWKKAHKMWSVRLSALVVAIAGLEPFVPELEGKIPPWAFAVASIAVIIARLWRQPKIEASDLQELHRIKSIAKKGGLISLVVLAMGCAGRQPESMEKMVRKFDMPPERAACLLATEAAYRARDKACGKNRETTCSTDWLIDKQHEEIDECFSNF